MKLTHDPRRNIAYLRLREKTGEVETLKVGEDMIIDIAPDGTVFGIELLNANEQLAGADGGRIVYVDPASGEERSLPLGGTGPSH